ncbi:pilus assembly protein FimV [Psychrobacter sp. N25K4-3-2]|jgi:pilus assembly protein FimV|uniref:FimV/HubP family polar landmark protein n=1 Tax=Psychrobacter sp. N25K4-3-2 TaxID=2785026 RepID=UPI00188A5039|nr:FimV/HubP family polar landmark protein [Psychrobacter sp. N25K4-3-2]MBF4488729.1 pilus assembly protein FimV [Psychrobacter sp. N25K4-3-2]
MDNMLYIIAGLVLILIIAVLVMRKNKAQKPSAPTAVQADKNLAASNPATTSGAKQRSPTQQSADNEGKFDNLSVAQRFINQQRYDKAIETLSRGLIEKPNDSQLLLKLLGIYATTNQTDDFYRVYDDIKNHSDPKSIAQADELKSLLTEEQNQAAQYAVAAKDTQNTDFESLDFDLPASQVVNTPTVQDTVIAEDRVTPLIDEPTEKSGLSDDFNDVNPTVENVDDTFDLTLNDLENDGDEPTATSVMPVSQVDIVEEENLTLDASDTTPIIQDNDISDFDFGLDLPEQTDNITEPSVSSTTDSAPQDIMLEDEDFVLDFSDLEAGVDINAAKATGETTTDVTQNSDDDFVLSLDDIDESVAIDNVLESEQPALAEDNDLGDFILEENNFKDNDLENDSFENNNFESNDFEDSSLKDQPLDNNALENTHIEASSMAPTAPLTFDEDTLANDDFDFDSLADAPTATTPVDAEYDVSTVDSEIVTYNEVETKEDFSLRFAADFDFVKTLDSNQVTLDLAGQYLQLGEYDSAKRLLNEVMTQGNSEQQQQAQTLLDRTA